MQLHGLTVHQARDLLAKREITAVELTQALLDRTSQIEGQIQAYLTLTPEPALEQARRADALLASGSRAPLLGVPMAIKDVISTRGIPTTCGSRMLEGYVPPYDATTVARLREAGAVLLGKTNTDEFAMGSSTENSQYFTTHNPWDTSRVPGGSSGGSAAAVAAGEATFALGSDTGGSVRQPAALCGVVGFRPTYGRVSRYGLVAYASSLDQIGPLTRDVADCALILSVIAGHDPQDSTSLADPVPDYTQALRLDIQGIKIGLPQEYFASGMDAEAESRVREALSLFEDLGATVQEVSLPHTRYSLPTYYLIAPSEASANLARYDGVKYGYSVDGEEDAWQLIRRTRGRGFGSEVKRRIMLGTYALSAGYYDAYYLQAQKVRTLIKQDFDRAFEKCDVLVAPTSPEVAFPIGEKKKDPLQMYMADIFVLAQPLAGLPAISIPCGFAGGLPVGMQIIGRALEEEKILQVAYTYEQATEWHKMHPPL